MPCYYCGIEFQDKDTVVQLHLADAAAQDHGGVLFENQRAEYAHQQCHRP